MDSTIVIIATVGLLGTALLVGLIFWITRARAGQAVAENESEALRKGQERKHAGDKIMAEPVADEADWIRRARLLIGLRDSDREP